VRIGFLVWAVVSTTWMMGKFRTRGVAPELLEDSPTVTVQDTEETLAFLPSSPTASTGLVFLVGAGVAAEAYAPLLRPIAEQGHPVIVVRLPWRVAPLERHKQIAVRRARTVLESQGTAESWVIAGHSQGGALAARVARNPPEHLRAVVLIGTSHPKRFDLSESPVPITKIYGTHDGVATVEQIEANRHLLPPDTRWIEIEGGNHSQFAHYGHQLFDGTPTVSRGKQQDITRAALVDALKIDPAPFEREGEESRR